MCSLRIFIAGSDSAADWTELTAGAEPAVRIQARDLQHAQRASRRVRAEAAVEAAVVLDLEVLIADDRRSARRLMSSVTSERDTVHYVGTVDGLAGLVADIYSAGVADGVTLIPVSPEQDARALGESTLHRLRFKKAC